MALIKVFSVCTVVLGFLYLCLHFTDLRYLVQLEELEKQGRHLWNQEGGGLLLVFALAVAHTIMIPANLLTVAAAAVLAPLPAVLTTFLGAVISAVVTYACARKLGAGALARGAGKTIERVKKHPLMERKGVWTMTLIRLAPVAPFTAFNLAAGVLKIRFRDFLVGTCLSLLPGKLVVFFFADRIRRSVRTGWDFHSLAPLLIAAGAFLGIYWYVRRRTRQA